VGNKTFVYDSQVYLFKKFFRIILYYIIFYLNVVRLILFLLLSPSSSICTPHRLYCMDKKKNDSRARRFISSPTRETNSAACPSVRKLFDAETQTKTRKVKDTSYPHDRSQNLENFHPAEPISERYSFNIRANSP